MNLMERFRNFAKKNPRCLLLVESNRGWTLYQIPPDPKNISHRRCLAWKYWGESTNLEVPIFKAIPPQDIVKYIAYLTDEGVKYLKELCNENTQEGTDTPTQ